jgi:integrative and conjugative element protein (TIGR02256 family)
VKAVPKENRIACFEIGLPPIVHGVVESEPDTLGGLADTLARRSADLFIPLKETLAESITEKGEAASSDAAATIFLLFVPICRKEGDEPDRIACRAFYVDRGPLALGEKIGALFPLDGKYFREHNIGTNPTPSPQAWRSEVVLPLEVLRESDAVAARRQSGITDPGPDGVLIGAGSLGSAILSFWERCGWGRWTVIDKDHIKPHNLSRHTAYSQHIGAPKANVVAELHGAIFRDTEVTPVVADAIDLENPAVSGPMQAAKLVVDVSTTLEYPRAASNKDDFARHVSVFMTPAGSSAVLLAEDAGRSIRVRSLEAQYYRALIQEEWGKDHLEGNAGTFWSGAGCRDISVVMPYSRIVAHASALAEQIPMAEGRPSASIRIWDRRADDGSIISRDIAVHPEHRMKFGEFDLFFDEGVERQLRELRNAHLPNETGGVLLGYYDFNVNAAVVVCGLPAPPDSVSTPTSFERGVSGLPEAVNEATRRTASVVGYIGEWHSHPPGHEASQSNHDILQLCHLAFGMADDGLPALQLIVGETDMQIFQGRIVSAE